MYDLIIIGAGPAGITAAVYAARKRVNLLVITHDIGGQAAVSGDVENYTGYQFISGPELAAKFEEHMRKYDIPVRENEIAIGLEKKGDAVYVKTISSTYESRTVIIASGKRSRELNVDGEKEFKNHGLTYCATCDGPLFSGKDVAVIGGGNSALDAAIQLINIAEHIYLINITPQLGGDAVMREKIQQSSIVTIMNNSRVTAVIGEKMVSGIRVKRLQPQSAQNDISAKNAKEELVQVEGVFVEIGLIPNSEFASIVEKNEYGEIKVNSRNETNIPGIFAAGDVTDVPEKQIIIASGEGSKACLSAFRYLAQNKF